MKRYISLCILWLLVGSTALIAEGQSKNHVVTADRLPATSRDFLNTHFGDLRISYVEVDKDLIWVKGYEVILIDGTEINFSRNGEWKEVDRRKNAVPAAIIPQEINQYMQANFPERKILSIEKETRRWEIKLENGMELDFNLRGELIDMEAD